MKFTFRKLMVLVIVLLLAIPISSNAASINGTANSPYYPQMFKDSEDAVKNLSTEFVGKYEVPMLSYSKTGQHHIYEAFKATSAVPGNCGPGNTWVCDSWDDLALVPGTVSNLAAENIMDTFTVSWVYQAEAKLRGARVEFMNDMTFVTDNWTDLIDLSKFGDTLVGAPSLQSVGTHYRLAVTIRSDDGDFFTDKLVYMYYIGNFNNSSCRDGGFAYQCDVIEEKTSSKSTTPFIGAPSLGIAEDGTVGMAYYKLGEGIRYAYPHESIFGWPANCGPDPHAYRCITIFPGTGTGVLGTNVKLALGKSFSERSIAFTFDDTLIVDTLRNAKYVGTGGNCGWDLGYMGLAGHRWLCEDVAPLGDLASWYSPSYSVDIDPQGYPVIAFDYAMDDFSPFFLYVTYPNARVGLPTPGWSLQKVDGAPTTLVATGAQAAFSMNSSGRGFIGYLQEEDYELPDLKIALQSLQTFLPIAAKP